ncbi:MAG: hypothetical protein SFV19_13575 [Rhodospirillaceae bacterium]|nr:hypothetical protein [Rhodospirillaceae bacterium]
MTRWAVSILLGVWATAAIASEGEQARHIDYPVYPPAPMLQTQAEADAKSAGCLTCHVKTDQPTMHDVQGLVIGCTDCHGGDAKVALTTGTPKDSSGYRETLDAAHVQPLFPESWDYPRSRNPERTYTLLNRESPEFIRFINPGDYRVAREACGACHLDIIQAAERSLMATGAMLWGGATYNNGILPFKNYILGSAYTEKGEPASIKSPGYEPWMTTERGVLPQFFPLPSWETTPPGDIFRVFERGGRNIVTQFPEIGLPNIATQVGNIQRLEEPGRPDIRQSNRGPATGLRIAVPSINIHKTRLNDPFTWFLGTNDQPGDWRSSGCTSCHVVYANDREPLHSGPYAAHGNMGLSITADPTIPKDEPGHPLQHSFTRAMPTSQCMVCHMHQPNIFLNSMLGYTMWDYESDAPFMWPEKQHYPDAEEMRAVLDRNPEEAVVRGKWRDVDFLKDVSKLNPQLKDTQFADYHGHGWNFRAILKRDRKGNLLDAKGAQVAFDDPDKWTKSVIMKSIHVEKGMHCVDCHFENDAHGNGYLYGEVANAIEIRCQDCHGTADAYPTMRTSGPAAQPGGLDLTTLRIQGGKNRFEWKGSECDAPVTQDRDCMLVQRSAVNPGLEWEMSLVKDSINPTKTDYNEKAARAKTMSKIASADQAQVWGPGVKSEDRAHKPDEMECYTCHLSWTTSCAGCHLPIQANWKTERHHFEGGETRNYATYNPQVARDEMFQLGIHQTTKGNTVAPVRSTSALILSSTNINREKIYIQQPPIAASGYSSQAFAPHYPHTERKEETKICEDCHVAQDNNNNAIMAQLLLQGTNFVNFVGYNAWVGGDGGVEAVNVTEWDEPQAVIGSYLHRYAYPDWFQQHQDRGLKLKESHTHAGGTAQCLQLRGEYLYVAEGPDGFQVYDVASIANKGISQRIITAPFSSLGQDTHIGSPNATCVALPTNQSIAPTRMFGDEERKKLMLETNQEQPFHPIYHYAFITDAVEGLIAVNVDTLADGEPRNNHLERAMTWNAGGVLTGARHITIAGTVFYISTPTGVVVLNMDDPLTPKVMASLPFAGARATAAQFRYLFVTDDTGFHAVDVTDPANPRVVAGASVPLADAQRIYVARTFAYVAAGKNGLAIIDVEKPEQPKLYQAFTADGQLNDARDVIVGTTNASLFAYVADGKNGLKVVQLTSPESQPGFYGFSPDPKPQLIAWWETKWPALALSKGLDRDRGADETGNQMAVFGRLGSRPFTAEEQRAFYTKNGKVWSVTNQVRKEDFRPASAPLSTAKAKAVKVSGR